MEYDSAVLLILVSIGLIYYNWHELLQDRQVRVPEKSLIIDRMLKNL